MAVTDSLPSPGGNERFFRIYLFVCFNTKRWEDKYFVLGSNEAMMGGLLTSDKILFL